MAVQVRMRPDHLWHMCMRVVAVKARLPVTVGVHVLMLEQLMPVPVRMVLGQVQPDAKRHQGSGSQQLPADGLSKKHDRKHGPNERCRRKIRAGTRGTQMPQSHDK